jgi:type VI secretion system protein ImpA
VNCISPDDVVAMLAPIEGELDQGEDLRNDISPKSSYQVLRDARTLARNNERAAVAEGESSYIVAADWRLILDKTPQVLKDESKDLEIVAWYIEALTRCFGFQGIALGYSLAHQLIEIYGESLYPIPDEDGISTQVAPLVGLNGFGGEGALIVPIKSISLTQGEIPGPLSGWQCGQVFELERIGDADKRSARLKQGAISKEQLDQVMLETDTSFIHSIQAQIDLAIENYEKFSTTLDQYSDGERQPTGKIKEALDQSRQMLTYIAGDRLYKEEEPDLIEDEDGELAEQGSAANGANISVKNVVIKNREEALKMLQIVATYFRSTEPHSPISYSVEQAIRWSQMPLTELIKELIPDVSARNQFQNLSGISIESK